MPFAFDEERLRAESGRRTIVLVGVRDIVRVELDLAIVEVEVRSVAEGRVPTIGNMPLSTHSTGGRGLPIYTIRIYSISSFNLLNFIRRHLFKKEPAIDKASSISSSNTLFKSLDLKTLVVFEKRVRRRLSVNNRTLA